jgi:outer membrane lipoprotein carrier protein
MSSPDRFGRRGPQPAWIAAAAAALVVCAAGPLAAQDAATVLARAEQAYRSLTTFTADFEQTLVNPMLGGPETTRGVLFIAPPGRFAMRWTDPDGERVVADGEWLWAFAPSSVPDQVIRQPIPQSGPSSPQLMAQFVDRPEERYVATYVGEALVKGELTDVLHLTPRRDGLPFSEAEIAVGRRDGLLRRIAVTEVSGQKRTLVLSGIGVNVRIPDAELEFEVPNGVRVVTP